MGPRLFRRGNSELDPGIHCHYVASMGPRLFRRGNGISDNIIIFIAMLQWGHVFSDVETRNLLTEMNGNAALQWGHVFSDVETLVFAFIYSNTYALQWGHVFSDVETVEEGGRDARYNGRFNGATSFQTWKPFLRHDSFFPVWGFNGATSFQTWKRRNVVKPGRRSQASMGPRLFRRGNDAWKKCRKAYAPLQWGHVFSDVETCKA